MQTNYLVGPGGEGRGVREETNVRAHLRVECADSDSSDKGQASQTTLGQKDSMSSDTATK